MQREWRFSSVHNTSSLLLLLTLLLCPIMGSFPRDTVLHKLQHGSFPLGMVLQKQTVSVWVPHGITGLARKPVPAWLLSTDSSSYQEPVPRWNLHGLHLPSGHICLLQWSLPWAAAWLCAPAQSSTFFRGMTCITTVFLVGCKEIPALVPDDDI